MDKKRQQINIRITAADRQYIEIIRERMKHSDGTKWTITATIQYALRKTAWELWIPEKEQERENE